MRTTVTSFKRYSGVMKCYELWFGILKKV